MSAISTILTRLRAAIWAKDVRDDIANAIEQCYSDVSNPTLQTEALEAALQNKIDEGKMAALTIGDHTITAAKLAQGVIDNTLATSGAAADAAETGRKFGLIKADLDDVNESLGSQTGIVTFQKNGYILLNGATADLTPVYSASGRSVAVVDCAEGDVFVLNAYSDSVNARTWGFVGSSNNIISVAGEKYKAENLKLTAPANAVKLVINDNKSGGVSYISGNNLASRVAELEKDGSSGLTEDIKFALLECFSHVGWEGVDGQGYLDDLADALNGNLHMVFSSGTSLGSSNNLAPSGSPHYGERIAARSFTSARAAAKHPIRNKGYVYTVTDSTKYNLCIQDIASMEKIPIIESTNRPDNFGYLTGTSSSSWQASASSTDPYIWIFLKKMDGTEFTAQELANEAAAVFTYAVPTS